MAIAYSKIEINIEEILLRDKPQAMLDTSPKGTVPVLILNNGEVIDESRDIMIWALAQGDEQSWYYGLTSQQQSLINKLIDTFDEQFKPILDKYKYSSRSPDLSEDELRNKALPYLNQLNDLLGKNHYLISQQLTLADMAIFPFIRQFCFVNKQWFDSSPYANLQAWLTKHLESALFQAVMSKAKD
ncbi:MAG: glutathione S-transferase [Gammaproteobacteria bacterium]|nr:MAG: glutathione S-transferase [Gammaproteobacteria bacterium]